MKKVSIESDASHPPHWVSLITATYLVLFCDTCWSDVYMQAQCGQTVRSLGQRIYSQIGQRYRPSINCSITLSGLNRRQKILLQIEDTDLRGDDDCNGDYLAIYDHSQTFTGRIPRMQLCGMGGHIAKKVTSKGDSLHLVFVTDDITNGRGFRAIVTALFSDKPCRHFSKFRCANRRCISASLTCDSVDHCGDASDESVNECTYGTDRDLESSDKVRNNDLIISEVIFTFIGATFAFLFFCLCIQQFTKHIVYIRRKPDKKNEEVEPSAGSPRASITSLRSRPTDTFVPNLEVKMSEFLLTNSYTLTLLKNAAFRGNDDRDKTIADEVSAGKKVHVGRFMVQKSVIEEAVEEYDEDPLGEEETALQDMTDNDDSEDLKRLSWIMRREQMISKHLKKERHDGRAIDFESSEDDVPDSDNIQREESKTLLQKVVSARAKSNIKPKTEKSVLLSKTKTMTKSKKSSSNRPLADVHWGNDLTPSSSQILVRPRTTPVTSAQPIRSVPYLPDWDFSDDDEKYAETSPTKAIGRFTVQKVQAKEMEHAYKNNALADISQTTTNERFAVQKVEITETDEVKNQKSTGQISAKGRFTIQLVDRDAVDKNASQTISTMLNTRGFSVKKVDNQSDTSALIGMKKIIQSDSEIPVGRFAVQMVKTPDINRKTYTVSDKGVINNLTCSTDLRKPVEPRTASAGRFTVQKVPEQDSALNIGDVAKDSTLTEDSISTLRDYFHISNSDINVSDSDDEYISVLETEI